MKSAVFDDPNRVSMAGLVPVMALAERVRLGALVNEHVSVTGAGRCARAGQGRRGGDRDGRRGGQLAGPGRAASRRDASSVGRSAAPTTLGTHLRAYAFGHVRQLDEVAARLLAALAARTPVLAGVEQVAWIDVDDTVKAMHGYAQQGVAYGYSKVKGLNAQLAVLSTPISAPVVAGSGCARATWPPSMVRPG